MNQTNFFREIEPLVKAWILRFSKLRPKIETFPSKFEIKFIEKYFYYL